MRFDISRISPTLVVAAIALAAVSPSCSEMPTGPSPRMEFVAEDQVGRNGSGPGLALVNMAGGYRRIGGGAGDPVWLPDGQRVVYWRIEQGITHVWISDVASGTESQLTLAGSPLHQERTPQASPDGQWVYVMGCDSEEPCNWDLWRVKMTGADARRTAEKVPVVPPPGNTAIVLRLFDVGRDGRPLIAYFTQSLTTRAERVVLAALDPSTGAMTELPVNGGALVPGGEPITGGSAKWSPDGRSIAYVGDNLTLAIVRADDGAVQMVFGPYEYGISWSPDGRYILARAIGGLHVIDLTQRTETPLTFAGPLSYPAWRPK